MICQADDLFKRARKIEFNHNQNSSHGFTCIKPMCPQENGYSHSDEVFLWLARRIPIRIAFLKNSSLKNEDPCTQYQTLCHRTFHCPISPINYKNDRFTTHIAPHLDINICTVRQPCHIYFWNNHF